MKIAIAVYLCIGIAMSGFTYADVQYGWINKSLACSQYRHDLAFAISWSALFWPISPIVTGFYENGYTLSRPHQGCPAQGSGR